MPQDSYVGNYRSCVTETVDQDQIIFNHNIIERGNKRGKLTTLENKI